MGRKKLVVISLDSLIYEDIEHLKTKPTFRMLLEGGSTVKRVKSVYPSITYVCHTTMATGCYPDKHGIVNNNYIVYEADPPWIFDHSRVKCPDILDAAHAAGLTTASVGWPVSGNHKSVDFLVTECWPAGADAPREAYREAYMENGTPEWLFNEVVEPHLDLRIGRKQPGSSYFLTHIAADIIKNHKPDLLMLHQGNVDKYRHDTGVYSDLVKRGLDECEDMVRMLVDATREAGTFADTNFIVTADHGQLATVRNVNINRLLRDNGFIKTDKDGNVTEARAWCQHTGMSAQVYLNDPADAALYSEVYNFLKRKRDEGVYGFSEVYTAEEYRPMHLDGDFSFVLETDGYSSFANGWLTDYVELLPGVRYGYTEGDHGYHPNKGPRPPFIAFGPDINKGVTIDGADLVDGAPTYAKILGIELPCADGVAISELIKGE